MFPAPLPRAKTRAEPREVRRVAIAEAQAKRDRKNAKRAPRRASNGDGNVRPDDGLIISCLDDTWRTPPAVHRLLESRGAVADIAYALERLARAGKIEAKHEAAMTGRAGPPMLSINYYRKLQKWPKSSSVGKLPTSPTDAKGRQQPARKKPAPPPPPPRPQGLNTIGKPQSKNPPGVNRRALANGPGHLSGYVPKEAFPSHREPCAVIADPASPAMNRAKDAFS
jgi:hypothetical protein